MKTKNIHSLSYPKFRKWLTDFNPKDVVGFSNSHDGCPVARYVSEITDRQASVTSVYCHTYYIEDGQWQCQNIDMPLWGSDFIDLIDSLGKDQAITAHVAISILDEFIDP
jgi:hypothetical protein